MDSEFTSGQLDAEDTKASCVLQQTQNHLPNMNDEVFDAHDAKNDTTVSKDEFGPVVTVGLAPPAPAPDTTQAISWSASGWSHPQFTNGGRDAKAVQAGSWERSNFADADISDNGPRIGMKFKCNCKHIANAITDNVPSGTSSWNMDWVFKCRPNCEADIYEMGEHKKGGIVYSSLSSVIELRISRWSKIECLVDNQLVYTSPRMVDKSQVYHYAISWHDANAELKDMQYVVKAPTQYCAVKEDCDSVSCWKPGHRIFGCHHGSCWHGTTDASCDGKSGPDTYRPEDDTYCENGVRTKNCMSTTSGCHEEQSPSCEASALCTTHDDCLTDDCQQDGFERQFCFKGKCYAMSGSEPLCQGVKRYPGMPANEWCHDNGKRLKWCLAKGAGTTLT